MTVPDLITMVMGSIRTQFYADRVREFMRDERALMKAVSRYGYECNQRGWEFEADQILKGIMTLLLEIRRSGAEIRYLPTYLHGAVGRHLGQRAEEYSSQAKKVKPRTAKIVNGLQSVEAVREPTTTEILSALYVDLKRVKPKVHNKKKEPKA